MSNWLRDKRKDNSEPLAIRPEVEALLPASVRPPDANRYAPRPDDADDDEDKDVDFLKSLASEVDRAGNPRAGGVTAAPPPLRGASPRIDDMEVFREMKDDGVVATRFNFHLSDVDMGDLLEELSTVRAALRRKAA